MLHGRIQDLKQKYETQIANITQEKDSTIDGLRERLAHVELKKSKNKMIEIALMEKNVGNLACQSIFDVWREYTAVARRKKDNEKAVSKNRSDGVQARLFQAWRQTTHLLHRKRSEKRRNAEVEMARANTNADLNDEMDTLRQMIIDLTEDLRVTTIEKNTLQYKFEQAMLRGMTALNLESLNIERGEADARNDLTNTSKQLLYSPDKLASLSPNKI